MGCEGCSTDNGLPKGCQDHGHCSTGACNMLNTYDWLADMPIAFGSDQNFFYEVSFQNGSRKDFYKNERNVPVNTGDLVVVETAMGNDIGRITLSGELVKLQMRKRKVKEKSAEIRNIVRFPNEQDLITWEESKALEKPSMIRARAIARSMNLEMKIGHVEYQADKKKATFYYTAEDRIDFRELIKIFARDFKVKIEMRQIGARQEAGKIGGIGTCGRELCCSTWLTDFKSVSTNAARYQNLSINLSKLSGQCGRLKCCLNYELDSYMEALQDFPKKADKLNTEMGTAVLQKTDILQKLMWYSYAESSNFYPLTVEQVKDILQQNEEGKVAASLGELVIRKMEEEEEEEVGYEDTVGQISLATLEKTGKKKKKKHNKNRNKETGGQKEGQQAQEQQLGQGQQQGQGQNRNQRQGQGPRQPGNQNRNQPRPPKADGDGATLRPPRAEGQTPAGNRPQQKGSGNRGNRNRGRGGGNQNRGGNSGNSNNPPETPAQ